jgi:hypothetical protein
MVKVYYFVVDDFSKRNDENQATDHKDGASCSSKDETVEKPKKSHSKVRMTLTNMSCLMKTLSWKEEMQTIYIHV